MFGQNHLMAIIIEDKSLRYLRKFISNLRMVIRLLMTGKFSISSFHVYNRLSSIIDFPPKGPDL